MIKEYAAVGATGCKQREQYRIGIIPAISGQVASLPLSLLVEMSFWLACSTALLLGSMSGSYRQLVV